MLRGRTREPGFLQDSSLESYTLFFLVLLGVVAGCAESESRSAEETRENASTVSFTEVTAEANLDGFRHATGISGNKWFPETMGSGGAFIDYDGDGWLDILLVGGGTWDDQEDPGYRTLWLYRNNGDGTFTLQTEEAGLGGVDAYGFGVAVADYNNDGRQDFYLTTLEENKLFRNDGGTFTEVGQEAGVSGGATWSSSAIFFDADRDGHLDLYVGNYVEWSPEDDIFCTLDGEEKAYCTPEEYEGIPGRFYRSNGDGTFTDETEQAGFDVSPGKTLGAAELDYNRDGWPDVVVANDTHRDLLFVNNGNGTFTEVGTESGIAYDGNGRALAGMGVDVGVVDSTGEETIFVGNFSSEMISVYRHAGSGLFTDRAAVSKIGRPSLLTLAFGLFLFDVELDGDLDLFVANGHVQPEIERIREGVDFKQPPQLFLNQQNSGVFEEAEREGVLASPLVARGAAYGDFNRDGKLDILITENDGGAHLWRNDTDAGRFLRVQLQGRESNREGVGARITAVAEGNTMERRVRTGASYLSQSEMVATFGLGQAARVDTLTIHWPSGQIDEFEGVAADQTLHIVEGKGVAEPAESTPAVAAGDLALDLE